jgi:hypothetical protein
MHNVGDTYGCETLFDLHQRRNGLRSPVAEKAGQWNGSNTRAPKYRLWMQLHYSLSLRLGLWLPGLQPFQQKKWWDSKPSCPTNAKAFELRH